MGNTSGGGNSLCGLRAGRSNTTGGGSSFFGRDAGSGNGSENAMFGVSAGLFNTTGSQNSFFGSFAGESNSTGNFNTMLGYRANVEQGNLTNATAVGTCALVTQSNSLILGSIANARSSLCDFVPPADTNVGIGTTVPLKRLEVGTSAVADGINLFGTAPAYFLSNAGKSEKAALAFAGSAGLYSTDAAAGDIVLRTNSGRLLLQHGT